MRTEIMSCHNGCKDEFWVSWMKKDVCVHEVLDESPAALRVRCDTCNAETVRSTDEMEDKIIDCSGYKTSYPRIEACSGRIVTSKDNEKETMKRIGYAPINGW